MTVTYLDSCMISPYDSPFLKNAMVHFIHIVAHFNYSENNHTIAFYKLPLFFIDLN